MLNGITNNYCIYGGNKVGGATPFKGQPNSRAEKVGASVNPFARAGVAESIEKINGELRPVMTGHPTLASRLDMDM